MIILWIKKRGEEPSRREGGEEDVFHRHDDNMKKFRVAHPRVEPPKPREKTGTSVNGLLPLERVTPAAYSWN